MANDNEKKMAGVEAAKYVKDGMTVGLGTGSTVRYTIEKLADRMRSEGLTFQGVPTSKATSELAKSLGISLVTFDDIDSIDVTIDGADEVDTNVNGIKGGGGALLLEKVVASASERNIWVADASKKVECLGQFPLPVEVIPFACPLLIREFSKTNMNPEIRKNNGEPFVTDSGNWIIDLSLGRIENPEAMEIQLNLMLGVVENGLFINRAEMALIADGASVHTFKRHV